MLARSSIGRKTIDHVTAVGLQPQRISIGRARLGVLPRNPSNLDHRHARAIGQHHRHLQQRAHIAPDMRLGVIGKRLRAIPTLQQKRLTTSDLRQLLLQPDDLRRHRHRRHTLEHLTHRRRLIDRPAGLLSSRLSQRSIQPRPQLIRQRRQRRQLVNRNIDGPVHRYMVTGHCCGLMGRTLLAVGDDQKPSQLITGIDQRVVGISGPRG